MMIGGKRASAAGAAPDQAAARRPSQSPARSARVDLKIIFNFKNFGFVCFRSYLGTAQPKLRLKGRTS